MVTLPELEHLKTVRQLCDEYPHLFTEGSLRWWIFRRKTNGFDRCIVRISNRLYIDTRQLQAWLGGHRETAGGDSAVSRRRTQRAAS